MRMNNNQMIASLISGYHYLVPGAKDDGYYDCEKEGRARINYIKNLAFNGDKVSPITEKEAEKIREFLDTDFNNDQAFHAFDAL